RTLVQLDAGVENRSSQRVHQQPRVHRRAVAEEDAPPEGGRRAAARDLLGRERDRLVGMSDGRGSLDGSFHRGVLARRGGDHEHAALAQPNVGAPCGRKRPHSRDDRLAGAREPDGVLSAEQRHSGRDRRPVAVEEPAVAAARPGAADLRLDEDDPQVRSALPQRERRPEPRIAAPDDDDVGGRLASEGRRLDRLRGGGERLLEPPRRQSRLDGRLHASRRARRFWKTTFANIPPTAIMKMAVPMTLICGGTATRAAPQTNSGNVIVVPALKYVITKSSIDKAKASRPAARIPGAMSGSVTRKKVTSSLAPRSIAASSRCLSKPTSRART